MAKSTPISLDTKIKPATQATDSPPQANRFKTLVKEYKQKKEQRQSAYPRPLDLKLPTEEDKEEPAAQIPAQLATTSIETPTEEHPIIPTTPIECTATNLAEEIVPHLTHTTHKGLITTIVQIASDKYDTLQIAFTRYTTDPESVKIEIQTSTIKAQERITALQKSLATTITSMTQCACHVHCHFFPLSKNRQQPTRKKGVEKTQRIGYSERNTV